LNRRSFPFERQTEMQKQSKRSRLEWMIEWLNDWVSEWLNDWVSEWLNEWVSEWVNEWMSDWMIDWMIDGLNDSGVSCCPWMCFFNLFGWHKYVYTYQHSDIFETNNEKSFITW
jgi:hypothetical protein